MGKTSNGRLSTASRGNESSNKSVDNKITELTAKNTPFDSSKFSYGDSKTKYDNYLLNPNHDDGGSKAKFLKDTLGYNKGDGDKLHKAIGEAINGKKPNHVEVTNYGTKYTFNTKIMGNDGKYHSANVVVVVQNDHGKKTWRLITLYPGKKD